MSRGQGLFKSLRTTVLIFFLEKEGASLVPLEKKMILFYC